MTRPEVDRNPTDSRHPRRELDDPRGTAHPSPPRNIENRPLDLPPMDLIKDDLPSYLTSDETEQVEASL